LVRRQADNPYPYFNFRIISVMIRIIVTAFAAMIGIDER
jgi:hypothetical protein